MTPKFQQEDELYKILIFRVLQATAGTPAVFALVTQLDVKESEPYNKAMQRPQAPQWSQAMKEELQFLHENKTWTLILKEEVESGHRPLGGRGCTVQSQTRFWWQCSQIQSQIGYQGIFTAVWRRLLTRPTHLSWNQWYLERSSPSPPSLT